MMWNREKLKAAIRQDTETLRSMKRNLRQTGHQITWKEAIDLREAKLAATIHCAMAAHLNGRRVHITKPYRYVKKGPGERPGFIRVTPMLYENGMTPEQQADFIKDYVAEFQIPQAPTDTPAGTYLVVENSGRG